MEQRFLYKSYLVFCILMRPAISFLKSKNFQLFVKKQFSLIIIPPIGVLQWCRKVSDWWIWMLKFHSDWQKKIVFLLHILLFRLTRFSKSVKMTGMSKKISTSQCYRNPPEFCQTSGQNSRFCQTELFFHKAYNFGHIMILGLNISPIIHDIAPFLFGC